MSGVERIAQRDQERSLAKRGGVTQGDRPQLGHGHSRNGDGDDHGQVDPWIGRDDLGLELLTFGRADQQQRCALHDMVGRQDLSLGADDNARSEVEGDLVGKLAVPRKPGPRHSRVEELRTRFSAHGQGLLRVLALDPVNGHHGWLGPGDGIGHHGLQRRDDVDRRRGLGLRRIGIHALCPDGRLDLDQRYASQQEKPRHQFTLVARSPKPFSYHFRFPSPGQPEFP